MTPFTPERSLYTWAQSNELYIYNDSSNQQGPNAGAQFADLHKQLGGEQDDLV